MHEQAQPPTVDPIEAILGSALPYEEQVERIVDLFLCDGDMDFEDYLPHHVMADFRAALSARNN